MRRIERIRKITKALLESKSPKKQLEGKRHACCNDLRYLCRDILGMKDWDMVHDDIQEFLDKIEVSEEKRTEIGRQFKLLMIPRGHLKSSIVTKGWTIQQICRNPNNRVLICNAVWGNARKFNSSIQAYLDNMSELPKIFGEFKPNQRNTSGWNMNQTLVNQRTIVQDAGTVTAAGLGSEQVGQHYDIIILDDLVARENISTVEQREKVKEFYMDCLSLLEPNGIMIVVGTTWHEDDLYASLRDSEQHPEFDTFIRVAEQGTDESVIFKKKFNMRLLMQIRGKTKESIEKYSSQYLLNPYPGENMEFKKRWVRYWTQLPQEPMYVSVTIDPSLGKDTSDWSAIVACGRTHDRVTYVLEARHFKRSVEKFGDEVVATVDKLCKMGRVPAVIGLEAFGFQQTLRKPIIDALKKANLPDYVELLPRKVTEGKSERIRALIPKFADYSVYVHESQQDLIHEMLRWDPEREGKSDDIIDALAWQIHYWDRRPGKVYRRLEKEGSLSWWMRNHKFEPQNSDNFILKEWR